MAAPIMNTWREEDIKNRETSTGALKKAHRLDNERIKQGWRWIEVDARTKMLVPCDKNGKPTPQGKRMLNQKKAML